MSAKSVKLVDNEWLFVTDALERWIKHVKDLNPDQMDLDEWADLQNDARRLQVIARAIQEQL